MPSSETIILVAAVTGLIGATGGLFAAIAAFRSAGVAKAAIQHAKESERRRLFGSVVKAAQRIAIEHKRIEECIPILRRAYSDLGVFSGTTRGSWLQPKYDEIDAIIQEVAPIAANAENWLRDERPRREDISDDELDDLHYEFSDGLGQLQVARERVREDLASVERQNQMYREQGISRN